VHHSTGRIRGNGQASAGHLLRTPGGITTFLYDLLYHWWGVLPACPGTRGIHRSRGLLSGEVPLFLTLPLTLQTALSLPGSLLPNRRRLLDHLRWLFHHFQWLFDHLFLGEVLNRRRHIEREAISDVGCYVLFICNHIAPGFHHRWWGQGLSHWRLGCRSLGDIRLLHRSEHEHGDQPGGHQRKGTTRPQDPSLGARSLGRLHTASVEGLVLEADRIWHRNPTHLCKSWVFNQRIRLSRAFTKEAGRIRSIQTGQTNCGCLIGNIGLRLLLDGGCGRRLFRHILFLGVLGRGFFLGLHCERWGRDIDGRWGRDVDGRWGRDVDGRWGRDVDGRWSLDGSRRIQILLGQAGSLTKERSLRGLEDFRRGLVRLQLGRWGLFRRHHQALRGLRSGLRDLNSGLRDRTGGLRDLNGRLRDLNSGLRDLNGGLRDRTGGLRGFRDRVRWCGYRVW
jgi:hypothetical protein